MQFVDQPTHGAENAKKSVIVRQFVYVATKLQSYSNFLTTELQMMTVYLTVLYW